MKTTFCSLLAVASLVGTNAFADASCHPHASLSCTSEYAFAGGSAAPGPTVSGNFQLTSDGEVDGISSCDAYANLKVGNTGVELDASISDMGDNQMSFSLFTLQGNQMSNTDFDQIGTNEYRATVTATGTNMVMNNGRMEKLEAITYTCNLNQP